MPPRRERHNRVHSQPHQQHPTSWHFVPMTGHHASTQTTNTTVGFPNASSQWWSNGTGRNSCHARCASDWLYINPYQTLHKKNTILTWHKFSSFSLCFSQLIFSLLFMLHNQSGYYFFLVCLDIFACSFLVCILQHWKAEFSMLQSSGVHNSTAQCETSPNIPF